MKRKIIEIDADKCDGCGLCVKACHEGAIALVEGKAVLVSDVYCDGLGDCIGECPRDAIRIVEREADDFDEAAVAARQAAVAKAKEAPSAALACGCPGSLAQAFGSPQPQAHAHAHPHTHEHVHAGGGCPGRAARRLEPLVPAAPADASNAERPSALQHWPVQLHLMPMQAPWYQNATLLVAADCVPFALAGFHEQLLPGRVVMIGCPKLDDVGFYEQKLSAILAKNDVAAVEVAYMEVPCCRGLVRAVAQAVQASGKSIPVSLLQVGVRGSLSRQG